MSIFNVLPRWTPFFAVSAAFTAMVVGCSGGTDTLTAADDAVSTSASAIAEDQAGGEPAVPDHGRGGEPGLRLDCTAPSSAAPADRPPPREGGPHGGRGGHGGGGGGGERPHGLTWVYDADGDGVLGEEEAAARDADLHAGCEARLARLLATYDADGDGTLDEAELDAARAAKKAEHDQRKAEALADFDADGDGTLDATERRAMKDARAAEILATYDADGDGTLDDSEKAALAEAIKAQIRSGDRPLRP